MPRNVPVTNHQQREMRELAAAGWPTPYVAAALDLSPTTVRKHAPGVGRPYAWSHARAEKAHAMQLAGVPYDRIASRLGYASALCAKVTIFNWRRKNGLRELAPRGKS